MNPLIIDTLQQQVNLLQTEIKELKELVVGQRSEKMFSVPQVACKLGLKPSGVNFHIRKGHIKAIGKRYKKIRESDLNNYIETLKKT